MVVVMVVDNSGSCIFNTLIDQLGNSLFISTEFAQAY